MRPCKIGLRNDFSECPGSGGIGYSPCSRAAGNTRREPLSVEIKFTICFCICDDSVLMVHRKRQPNQFRWNGIGGKLELGETPRAGVAREVLEETGIHLNRAASIDYAGIVTWPDAPRRGNQAGGMHAFIARFDDASVRWDGIHSSDEGDIAWHSLQWVSDRANPKVVDNISHSLPRCCARPRRSSIVASMRTGSLSGWRSNL